MRLLTAMLLSAALAVTTGCGSKFRRYDGPEVTSIVVFKDRRQMYLMHGNTALKIYDIALGTAPLGDKQVEGDGKTPEGVYVIDRRNGRSSYHLSLGISYPNEADVAQAEALGMKPGGDIFIHGRDGKNRGRGPDWTAGCISVKDGQMEEIFAMVRTGTTIFIKP